MDHIATLSYLPTEDTVRAVSGSDDQPDHDGLDASIAIAVTTTNKLRISSDHTRLKPCLSSVAAQQKFLP